MAITYHYFSLQARGLTPLLCLEVGKVEYRSNVVPFEKWADIKATGKYKPFNYVPALELRKSVDELNGLMISETVAICNTIGRLGGLLGDGKDYAVSQMLLAKSQAMLDELGGLNMAMGKSAALAPTVFTVQDWNAAVVAKAKEQASWASDKAAALAPLLLPPGDRFTAKGDSVGELNLFSVIHQASACFPEFRTGPLAGFYARVGALAGVQKVLRGKSRHGPLPDYFVPYPKL